MGLSNFNLRGIPPEVMLKLKKEAQEQHTSINAFILKTIEQGIGFSRKNQRKRYHDLDHLSGTWSKEDTMAFEENTYLFEKIDDELWG